MRFSVRRITISPSLKLTAGLRWTVDRKHFADIPSELVDNGFGYPVTGTVNQELANVPGGLS